MKFRSLPRTNPSPSHPPSVSRTSPKHKDGTPRPTTVQYMCSHSSCPQIYVRTMCKTINRNIVVLTQCPQHSAHKPPYSRHLPAPSRHDHQTKTARDDSHSAVDAAPTTGQPKCAGEDGKLIVDIEEFGSLAKEHRCICYLPGKGKCETVFRISK
jgi:hypothetical protein